MTDRLVGSERQLLESMVNSNRDAIAASLEGLTEQEARGRLVPSLTSPLSIVKHCAAAERVWFQRTLAEIPVDLCDGYAVGDDQSWETSHTDSIATVISEFERARQVSNSIASRYSLDHVARHYRRGEVSLRWIHLHMIEELARHAGHADILVEQLKARRLIA